MAEARAALSRHFGYADFRAPQRPAVEAVLAGGDVLIMLPTGGGKSLCYQVPALIRRGLTVVVSPLISLMKDQVEALERRGLNAALLNSMQSGPERADVVARVQGGDVRLLYLAPETLTNERLLDLLDPVGVTLLAVDEAHCISEWGHDFRPAYRRIGEARARLGQPQTVALTATATPTVRADIVQQLALRTPVTIAGGFDRTNLTYSVKAAPTLREKYHAAVQQLREAVGPAVVYASTRSTVEQVTAVLQRAHLNAVAYHGGLPAETRLRAQDAFMSDRARVIVATSAFGMGIDKPNVRLVLHHAMPGSLEAYYQEAGRAGRDGAGSHCVLLHGPGDRATHEHFLRLAHPGRTVVEGTWRVLRSAADARGQVILRLPRVRTQLSAVGSAEVTGAAVRVLLAAGACTALPPDADRVYVRLLASAARVRRELGGAALADRLLLRECWRRAGAALYTGCTVQTDHWPVRARAPEGLVPVFERLAARQFVMWTRTGGGLQLGAGWERLRGPPVDWERLARRARAEQYRLEAMVEYALRRDCRRAYVLRYFGDHSARDRCDACDCCLNDASVAA